MAHTAGRGTLGRLFPRQSFLPRSEQTKKREVTQSSLYVCTGRKRLKWCRSMTAEISKPARGRKNARAPRQGRECFHVYLQGRPREYGKCAPPKLPIGETWFRPSLIQIQAGRETPKVSLYGAELLQKQQSRKGRIPTRTRLLNRRKNLKRNPERPSKYRQVSYIALRAKRVAK